MKKKLESELINIALRIIRLDGKGNIDELHADSAILFEKLSVLKFLQETPQGEKLTNASDSSFFGMLEEAFDNKVSDGIEASSAKAQLKKNEPVIKKIKDIVSQMPYEPDAVDDLFEPVGKSSTASRKQSLNDKLKLGDLNIDLNDKIAFIKQLFAGDNNEYDRVISQINKCRSFNEAIDLINNDVKKNYDNWAGKHMFEERLFQIIEARFK